MNRIILLSVLVIFIFAACSEDHTDLPSKPEYNVPPPPTDFVLVPGPASATLTWDYEPTLVASIEGFRVYRVYISYDMSEVLELVGTTDNSVMSYTDEMLIGNYIYCYRVSAVCTCGVEGWRSEVLCDTIPISIP